MKALRSVTVILALTSLHSTAAVQPNILVILADDAGYADFGFQGGGIANDYADLTPHLDALAAGGVQFSSGYVTGPICSPSRAGLLSGRYPQRFGFENNIGSFQKAGLPAFQPTIADHLRALGYRTYAIGKWHLGEKAEQHPNARGFDTFFGFTGGKRTYFQYSGGNTNSMLQLNGTPYAEAPNQYLTDLFATAATNFISAHVASTNSPFFMYLAFNAVHTPVEADNNRMNDPRIQDIPPSNRRTNAAMTIAVDDAVGMLMQQLDDLNIRTNTLVVFLNDNGGPENNPALEANGSDNGLLREGKRSLHEGGIRVPFIVNWPGTVAHAGTVLDDPVISLDLLPTFVAAAGGSLFPSVMTDGVNLLPRISGVTTNPIERSLFWRTEGPNGEQSAVRKGNWKLYRGNDGSVELYNLATDVSEITDLAAQEKERVDELLKLHAEWETETLEPIWGFGSPDVLSNDLAFTASEQGYALAKASPGFDRMSYELRSPLSLSNDWRLTWSMSVSNAPGASRNGYAVLMSATNSFSSSDMIRAGMDLDSGQLTIAEVQNGVTLSRSDQPIPAPTEDLYHFQLSFSAASGALTLRYATNQPSIRYAPVSITHTLSNNYNEFSWAGYALRGHVLADFSPIRRQPDLLSNAASPSWTRLRMARDFTPGTYDTNGFFMGGTELMSLVSHKGRLYAGIGYWNDERWKGPSEDPFPGAQILVKEDAGSPWQQEVAFGTNYLRVECLRSVRLTTDRNGVPLDPPVELLLAGVSPVAINNQFISTNVYVYVRNDATGQWMQTYVGDTLSKTDRAAARVLFDHIDRVTGVHHVFCAYGTHCRIVRGGYNAATGLIEWDSSPELGARERMVSGGDCNGWAYACIGSDGDPDNGNGGVFWREDGAGAVWHLITEFPKHPNEIYQDIRGFTAVPHPDGFNYEVALVELNAYSTVMLLDPIGGDPRNGHRVKEEVNIETFLGNYWNDGLPINDNIIAAYNDMPELSDPVTGESLNFLGLYIKKHPAGPGSMEQNNTWYLIRRPDATYDWGMVLDPADPIPNPILRSCRAARPSPFPSETGHVIYLGGFDGATTSSWHNTAWIYRAELVGESGYIRLDAGTPTVGINTVLPWIYQLESSSDLNAFQPYGNPFTGSNDLREVQISTPLPDHAFYRWTIRR